MTQKKKLIEVSLPLEVINTEAAREKNIRQGHPSTLHLYWARRPLAAARAVLFAQLVDDPSARPEEFPTVALQDEERARLHRLVEKLVVWENSGDDALIEEAREEIRKSNNGELPAVLDPFAGGGAIPLEAHRLGLDANASDLNPLAVLINKSLIEIPPTVAGKPPVFPGLASTRIGWDRAEGLAADVRAYGEWMKERAQERIGHLYPDATLPDGSNAPVIAWLWARTVTCPNPACGLSMPLVKSWWLSKKKDDEAYIAPSVVDDPSDPLGRRVHFAVRSPKASAQGAPEEGTVGRQGARCVGCESAVPLSYVRAEAQAGRMHQQLMAIVAEANRRRVYLEPSMEHSQAADVARPETVPIGSLPPHSVSPNSNQTVRIYGFTEFADLFTNRQLTTLTTLNGLVAEARERIRGDAERSIRGDRGLKGSDANENERALNYANAVATYLALGVSRLTDISNALCRWENTKTQVRNLFGRQNIPMVWDFAEAPPFGNAAGSFLVSLGSLAKAIDRLPTDNSGRALQADASTRDYSGVVVSTDPPYYDNIGYSDLSDFFYIWLRQSLESIYPELLSTVLVPKTDELVANPHRLGGKQKAEEFFVSGFNRVFKNVREGYADSDDRLLTVYYAYKQQEVGDTGASSSTGWHTLLDGLIDTGWEITATWPMRTETANRMIASGANALASSIVLACRPRPSDAPTTTRRALAAALRLELPDALRTLIQGSIAAVDLDQAAIGPGIAVFSRYSRVREADGTDMTVRDALELINTILDEVVDELSDSDADSRFAAKWYRQFGWGTAVSGTAITMAQSAGTSLGALERGGIFEAKGGRARLLSPTALEDAWDVLADERVSVWEATVRLASVMARDGADRVAQLIPDVQERVSLGAVKQMSLWLFREAEKKRDTKDAILFNGLVSAWGDVNEQARKHAGAPRAIQQAFDFDEDGD